MSWAADNPEAYDEIMKSGIVSKIKKELDSNGFEGMDEDTVSAVVEVLSQSKVYSALVSWAQRETSDAEADYWASIADRSV